MKEEYALMLLVSVVCLLTACSPLDKRPSLFLPSSYSAEPIEGWVVDEASKLPLEGAIVIALWELEKPYNLENDIPSGHIKVIEVLTDAEGHYQMPGWGPEKRPRGKHLADHDPSIVVFKDGYRFNVLYNGRIGQRDHRYEKVHKAYWNGKAVKLEKFEGDLEEYYYSMILLFGSLESILTPVFGAEECDWQKIPHMVMIFDKYHQRLQKELPRNFYSIPSLEELTRYGGCGTREEFLRKYQQ